jgi:hypothetical protein
MNEPSASTKPVTQSGFKLKFLIESSVLPTDPTDPTDPTGRIDKKEDL